MIKYTLKCPDDHRFDSWFASAEAFEGLLTSGHLNCAVCGKGNVAKAMMAPQVSVRGKDAPAEAPDRPLSAPTSDMEAKIAALRAHVEANSDYVGGAFAKEARAMHEGTSPERSIFGEANGQEVKTLLEDGVPIAPLPFAPQRKVN